MNGPMPAAISVHLIDGTWELFRYFFALPAHRTAAGVEVGALRGVLGSMLGLLEDGATHVGVATDHVIESFRNELWPGYKTGEGVDPLLLGQLHPLEDALEAMGVPVWRMVELEADDGIASAAALARREETVERIYLCSPDKDLAQCVEGSRIVQLDRSRKRLFDDAGVREKFGIGPESIPDWLALVGDASDGYPGLPGFGPRSASGLLARFRHIESIPDDPAQWQVPLRGTERLGRVLREGRAQAMVFKDLATLRATADVGRQVDDWLWCGPSAGFERLCATIDAPALARRAWALAARRGPASAAPA